MRLLTEQNQRTMFSNFGPLKILFRAYVPTRSRGLFVKGESPNHWLGKKRRFEPILPAMLAARQITNIVGQRDHLANLEHRG